MVHQGTQTPINLQSIPWRENLGKGASTTIFSSVQKPLLYSETVATSWRRELAYQLILPSNELPHIFSGLKMVTKISWFYGLPGQLFWSGSAQLKLDGLEPSFAISRLTSNWSRTSTWTILFYPYGLSFFSKPAQASLHVHLIFGFQRAVSKDRPQAQAFTSLCLCHNCYHLIGQNRSRNQAQSQCERV